VLGLLSTAAQWVTSSRSTASSTSTLMTHSSACPCTLTTLLRVLLFLLSVLLTLGSVIQLNPDKSEALAVGTSSQLNATLTPASVSVAGTDLPTADYLKVLGVVLVHHLSFDRHVTSVARACNFHAHAI